jgi:hypothetical protein
MCPNDGDVTSDPPNSTMVGEFHRPDGQNGIFKWLRERSELALHPIAHLLLQCLPNKSHYVGHLLK